MEINFKASLISKTQVMKRTNLNNKYVPHEVSFIQLDTQTSQKDIDVLKKLRKIWPKSYAADIYRDNRTINDLISVYALTTQQKEFDKLSPERILGLAEITNGGDEVVLEYIQTNPAYTYEEEINDRSYKGIGKALLNSLKSLKHINVITLSSLFSKLTFYEENGFEVCKDNGYEMIWKRKS